MTFHFDPASYGPVFAALIDLDYCSYLGPGTPNSSAGDQLAKLSLQSAFASRELVDRQMGMCCLSAIWLLHDYLDESHSVSQGIPTTSGSYWHGIMHRREPDYSNAKYWFRKVGHHEVFDELAKVAGDLAERAHAGQHASFLASQHQWDAFPFVDLCQQAAMQGGELASLCRAIGQAEWCLLFDFCYRRALGDSRS